MKIIFFIVASFFGFAAFGQKETSEVIDAKGVKSIVISSDEVFRINLSTAPGAIRIKTRADGEYSNDIYLDSEINGEVLLLTSRFREILKGGYDKLSAHKVFAMEVELVIPENLTVEIESNLASVKGSGDFKKLFIELKSGYCQLEDFTGDATINTYDGHVLIQTVNAKVEADSRHGSVNIPDNNFGQHTIKVTSINGNITVHNPK